MNHRRPLDGLGTRPHRPLGQAHARVGHGSPGGSSLPPIRRAAFAGTVGRRTRVAWASPQVELAQGFDRRSVPERKSSTEPERVVLSCPGPPTVLANRGRPRARACEERESARRFRRLSPCRVGSDALPGWKPEPTRNAVRVAHAAPGGQRVRRPGGLRGRLRGRPPRARLQQREPRSAAGRSASSESQRQSVYWVPGPAG